MPYNLLYNDCVTITRQNMTTNFGNSYALEIQTTGTAVPGHGGFLQNAYTQTLNEIYIQHIIAKIPQGYYLNYAYNYIGTNQILRFLTNNKGTGEWKEYILFIKTGSQFVEGNSWGNFGYIYLQNEIDTTVTYPITWYVSYSNMYKVNANDTVNNTYWFEFSDNEGSGVKYYQINNNITEPRSWNTIGSNEVIKYTPTSKGTYYIWFKDDVGNISNYEFVY